MYDKKSAFKAVIEKGFQGGAYIAVPQSICDSLGSGGRLPVKATFDGIPYRGTIVRMGGVFRLGILKEIRSRAGKDIGDAVTVEIEPDRESRTVSLPDDFRNMLNLNPDLMSYFNKLSYTHRKEYVRWIEEAKKPDTRLRRLEKAITMLKARQHL